VQGQSNSWPICGKDAQQDFCSFFRWQNSPSLSNTMQKNSLELSSNTFNEQRSSEMSSTSQQHSEELETVVEVVEETVLTMDDCS
jgi:hypothetical protein